MNLATLIDNLPVTLRAECPEAARSIDIADVTENSQAVSLGSLFIARKGLKHDGRAFIGDAVERGAVAVLSEGNVTVPHGAVSLVAEDVPAVGAQIAERFCGSPSRDLTLIGVTGTNGKTTIAHLIHAMLNARRRCGLIGTVEVDDGAERQPAQLTTPPAIDLSRLLRRMVENGCEACVMEASSHALQQHRVTALAFDIAIFTNLSGDHMDYHGDAETYRRMKVRLFEMLPRDGLAIINADDPNADAMITACDADIWRCSMNCDDAMCYASVRDAMIASTDVALRGPWGEIQATLPLCGKHNVMNVLQSVAAAHRLGLDRNALAEAVRSCAAPPGRLEPITTPDDSFAVYVDYAHTDDALDNVLQAVRPLVPEGGLLHVVFGCGGDRDATKRPRMAEVACRYGDRVIITSDNPRFEDPQHIVDEIARGVPAHRTGDVTQIVDRREAIRAAIAQARPGDIVLITGKGHEDYQEVKGVRRPFDDRIEAKRALTACIQEDQEKERVTTL